MDGPLSADSGLPRASGTFGDSQTRSRGYRDSPTTTTQGEQGERREQREEPERCRGGGRPQAGGVAGTPAARGAGVEVPGVPDIPGVPGVPVGVSVFKPITEMIHNGLRFIGPTGRRGSVEAAGDAPSGGPADQGRMASTNPISVRRFSLHGSRGRARPPGTAALHRSLVPRGEGRRCSQRRKDAKPDSGHSGSALTTRVTPSFRSGKPRF